MNIGRAVFPVAGAFLGGIFPGAWLVNSVIRRAATGSALNATGRESVCLLATIFVGIAGSFLALGVGTALARDKLRALPSLAAVGLGTVAGLVGYCWIWAGGVRLP